MLAPKLLESLHLISLFFICSSHNHQPPSPFSPSNGKKDGKKQQQPLLPVKLLVAPLTGESKAIKMTRRQIVCDTSKGLEKAGKLSSATSSYTLRRERGEKKNTKPTSTRRMVNISTQRLPRSPLGLPPDPNTDSSPATTRPMITLFPLSCSEGLINALICK